MMTFFAGNSGNSGNRFHNRLKTRLVAVLKLVPTAENPSGNSGNKKAICSRCSQCQKSEWEQTEEWQALCLESIAALVPTVPTVPAKKHHYLHASPSNDRRPYCINPNWPEVGQSPFYLQPLFVGTEKSAIRQGTRHTSNVKPSTHFASKDVRQY